MDVETPRSGFNSRSRVGSDGSTRARMASKDPFQFTLPCRERLYESVEELWMVDVSIHAPV